MEKLQASTGKRKSSEPMNSFGLGALSISFGRRLGFDCVTY
jgi:hypothetical protein